MLKPIKVTISSFVVVTTSKERLEQEIRDFLEQEIMYSEEPDSPVEIKLEDC